MVRRHFVGPYASLLVPCLKPPAAHASAMRLRQHALLGRGARLGRRQRLRPSLRPRQACVCNNTAFLMLPLTPACPRSRCLPSGGAPISRVDWGTFPPSAGCYPMSCAAVAADAEHPWGLQLLVTVSACNLLPCHANSARAMEVACPPGGFIELNLLSLGFTRGRLGPCPVDPRPYCTGLGCAGDCGGDRGACVNPSGLPGGGSCVCHPGYVGASCSEVACTPAGCAARNASCSPFTGRCATADGNALAGLLVVEPRAAAAPLLLRAAAAPRGAPPVPSGTQPVGRGAAGAAAALAALLSQQ
jgi:hypothetical protein